MVAAVPATAAEASSPSNVCAGTPNAPGVLQGVHWGTVWVKGACAVNGGAAVVHGNLVITGVRSCWLGTARVHVHRNAVYVGNQLADPDAIEIVSNHVDGALACFRNSRTWDSGDLSNKLFPRAPQPNTVLGGRSGQCVLNSPTSPTDKPGPGLF